MERECSLTVVDRILVMGCLCELSSNILVSMLRDID